MVSEVITDAVFGVYLGILAGLFPAVVAFTLGFVFRYLTGVSIPGFGVVVLAGGLAGISGGLLGLLDANVAGSWAGISAFLVILMLSLWAHNQGDRLGASVPRGLTLTGLRQVGLSEDILDRVDSYGQVRIRPLGGVEDIEGYPPLSEETREKIRTGAWKFPAELSLPELEGRLAEKLAAEHDLSEVSVSITSRGLAEIRAAPGTAGLSRRVPPGKRAVSVPTLLPTGLARGDTVSLDLPDGAVTGDVVSARTEGVEPAAEPSTDSHEAGDPQADGGAEPPESGTATLRAPTTTGGDGEVTVALPAEEARRVVTQPFAKLSVHARGTSPEYRAVDILHREGNQLRSVTVRAGSQLDGTTVGAARVRDSFAVGILAVRRTGERVLAPRGSTPLRAGDELIVTGKPDAVRSFREAIE